MMGFLRFTTFIQSKSFSIFFLWILMMNSGVIFAQVDTRIDKDHIKIGEQINYSIRVPLNPKSKVQLPILKDTLSYHIEILEQKIDTVIIKEKKYVEQKLIISSFEAGNFLIRSFPVIVGQDTLLSHSFDIKVDSVHLDPENKLGFPIKPILKEELTLKDYWEKYGIYVLFFLGILMILVLIYYIIKKKKKEKSKPEKIKTPYDEVLSSLKALDKKRYLDKKEIYPFYSELSFILRRYIGRVYQFSSLEFLSDDLVEYLKKQPSFKSSDLKVLEQFLYDSDLVKFAKAIPEENKHEYYRKWIGELIEKIKPQELEDDKEEDESKTQKNK